MKSLSLGLIIFALGAAASGCAAAWKDAGCSLEDRPSGGKEWRCRCTEAHQTIATPPGGKPGSGSVTWLCDGKPLPVVLDAEHIPPCGIAPAPAARPVEAP